MKWLTRLFKKPMTRKLLIACSLIGMIAFTVYTSITVFALTSLRLDEAQSLFQTNRDLGGLLYAIGQDVHVPLYHIFLHYWQTLFGNDIFTARMMSLVFFVATIPTVYFLTKYAFRSRKTALFAALLVTISPFMAWYGSEARMYSMLAFFTVAHQFAFLKLYREGKPVHWTWFTITAILGMYTHYFFAFVLIAEVVFYLFMYKKFAVRKSVRKFFISAVLVVAAVAPWIYYVLSLGAANNTQPNLANPTSVDLFNTYAQFIFGFQVDSLNTIIVSLWPIVVLLAFFGLQKNKRTSREALYFIAISIIPVLAAFLISVTITPFYQSRYLIVSLPALLIFIAWIISIYPKRLAFWLRTVLVIGIMALFAVQIANPQTPVKEDYKDSVRYLSEEAGSRDVIILSAPFTIYPMDYYYRGEAKVTTQPIWDRFQQGAVPGFDPAKLEEETNKNTDSYQTAWLMLSYDQGYNDEIRRYYDNNFERTSAREFSKDLWVYSYRLRYDPPIEINNE